MPMRVPVVLSVLLLLVAVSRLPAGTNDATGDQYFRGYLLKNEAERLEKAGDLPGAVQKYREASQIIGEIARTHPDWQPEVVQYRLKKIEREILKLCAKADLPVPAADAPKSSAPSATPPQAPSTPDWDTLRKQQEKLQRDLDQLKERLRQAEHSRVAPLDPGFIHP